MAILTVAIPSYNRNNTLAENVALLLPQLTPDCVLTIIDNGSDIPIAETLGYLKGFDICQVNLLRNRVNIGACANVLRCLETCTTDWVWILGDDDPVKPEAIANILQHVKVSPECLYINFRSGLCPKRDGVQTGRGISAFADSLDSFSNALFISTSVYHASAILRFINFGYQYAYSYAPHLAVVFAAMGEEGHWSLADSEIVSVVTTKAVDQLWNPLLPALGKMTLLELPMGDSARRVLGEKLASRPRPELLVLALVRLAYQQKSAAEAMFFYSQLSSRLYWGQRGPITACRRILGGLLIRNPSFTNWALNFVTRRLAGTKWEQYQNIIERAGQSRWHRLL